MNKRTIDQLCWTRDEKKRNNFAVYQKRNAISEIIIIIMSKFCIYINIYIHECMYFGVYSDWGTFSCCYCRWKIIKREKNSALSQNVSALLCYEKTSVGKKICRHWLALPQPFCMACRPRLILFTIREWEEKKFLHQMCKNQARSGFGFFLVSFEENKKQRKNLMRQRLALKTIENLAKFFKFCENFERKLGRILREIWKNLRELEGEPPKNSRIGTKFLLRKKKNRRFIDSFFFFLIFFICKIFRMNRNFLGQKSSVERRPDLKTRHFFQFSD